YREVNYTPAGTVAPEGGWMSRLLCVWELGTGYGHLGRLLPVALELRQRGHEVVFALRDLTYAEAFLGRRGFRLLQSPVWMGEGRGGDSPLNYAELLGNFGFLDEAGLRSEEHTSELQSP